jgi:hypothetical protein
MVDFSKPYRLVHGTATTGLGIHFFGTMNDADNYAYHHMSEPWWIVKEGELPFPYRIKPKLDEV